MRLSKAIQQIQRLSLVVDTLEGSNHILRIHDLVHFILRSRLVPEVERAQRLQVVIRIIYKAFDEIEDRMSPQNRSRCGQFISHIEFLENFARQYKLENTKLLDASAWAGSYLNACGLYSKAAIVNKRTCDQKRLILGEEYPSTLSSIANLA